MRQEEHSGQRNSVVQRPRDKRKQVARLGRWHLEFGSARKLLWAFDKIGGHQGRYKTMLDNLRSVMS